MILPAETDMPNYMASVSQLGGEVSGEEMICERSQENNDDEIIHAQHQGIFLPDIFTEARLSLGKGVT